jgi:hypothetical protein
MAGFTTAMPTSFKAEILQALHNFTTTTGNDFRIALGVAAPTGTYGAATTNYSNLTGNSDEVTGTGYTAGGFDFTAANNTTPLTSGTTAYTTFATNATWTTATFSASGCIIYNATNSNRAVYVGSFGGTQSVNAGTFTVVMPANAAGTALLAIQ